MIWYCTMGINWACRLGWTRLRTRCQTSKRVWRAISNHIPWRTQWNPVSYHQMLETSQTYRWVYPVCRRNSDRRSKWSSVWRPKTFSFQSRIAFFSRKTKRISTNIKKWGTSVSVLTPIKAQCPEMPYFSLDAKGGYGVIYTMWFANQCRKILGW